MESNGRAKLTPAGRLSIARHGGQTRPASVDDYLNYCAENDLEPDKPASGKLMLRIPPEVHAAALVSAQTAGESLNQWATRALAEASAR